MIDEAIRTQIVERLDAIEREYDVRILYACESGSRVWGFPSLNSDYDVRFIYARPRDWYFSINVEDKRDVIERPINDLLDINGWDVRKALRLLRKSNPPLLEWLASPIVYREDHTFTDGIRAAIPASYSPVASFYHYLNMARNNDRTHLKGDVVRAKKYFYVLRPLLAVLWIEQDLGMVPIEFATLVERCVPDSALRAAIDDLVERKRGGEELADVPRIDVISDFIDEQMERLATKTMPGPRAVGTDLDRLFRAVVDR